MRPPGTPDQLQKRRRRAVQLLQAGRPVSAVARQVQASGSSVWRSRGVVPSGLTVLPPRAASRGPETSETRLVGSGLGGLSRDETAAAPRNAPRAE